MNTLHNINTLLFIIPVLTTLYATFQDRIKRPHFLLLIVAVFSYIGASFIGTLTALQLGSTRITHTAVSLASILGGVLIFYSVMRYRLSHCLFIIAIIKCYADDTFLFASAFYFAVKGQLPSSFSAFPVWPLLIVDILTLPLILLFYKKMLRPALDETEELPFWSLMWVVPLCSNVIYAMCISPLFSPNAAQPGVEFYFVPFLWTTLSFIMFMVLLRMIMEITQNTSLQTQLSISELHTAAQQKQVQTLQRHMEQTSRLRHDQRHHLLVMQELLAKKDYESLSDYLSEYNHRLEQLSPKKYTENPVLNTILCHYCELAESNGIEANVSVILNSEPPISNSDMCIVLGNLLENAVEACCRQTSGRRFLNVKIAMKSPTIFVLLVENSFDGTIQKQGEDFLSSKEKGRRGIGISSVQRLAERYHGICRINWNSSVFKVNLLLNAQRT